MGPPRARKSYQTLTCYSPDRSRTCAWRRSLPALFNFWSRASTHECSASATILTRVSCSRPTTSPRTLLERGIRVASASHPSPCCCCSLAHRRHGPEERTTNAAHPQLSAADHRARGAQLNLVIERLGRVTVLHQAGARGWHAEEIPPARSAAPLESPRSCHGRRHSTYYGEPISARLRSPRRGGVTLIGRNAPQDTP